MEKEFIPYEISLALKELGFDEICLAIYTHDNQELKPSIGLITSWFNEINDNSNNYEWKISAPTYSQAFRWFREKHKLKGHIEAVEYLDGTPDTYHWSIFNQCNSGYDQLTHEEAELECLKKLIEIAKQKS